MITLKILICDDEELIRNVIKEYLTLENFTIDEAEDGHIAVSKCKETHYDLIIMDIMMPHMDGYQAVREIKKIDDVPCIMLSARGEEYDKLMGFDLGIDDYITKPFSPKELVARVKAILKRNKKETSKYVFGTLVVDDLAHSVTVDNKKINLTLKEYELLKLLMTYPGIVFTREQLLNSIWGTEYDGETRTVDVHVRTLRQKLGDAQNHISTIRGVGYRFEENITYD